MKRINWRDYKNKKILIYGAHLVAVEVYRDICRDGFDDSIIGFAVTYKDDNPDVLEGLPVRMLSDYKDAADDTLIVIAMPGKFHGEVKRYAGEHGFSEFLDITLEDMSKIKGDKLVESWNEKSFKVRTSQYDPSWLDGFISEPDEKAVFKFPTLFYLNEDQVKNHIDQNNPADVYSREMKNVVSLHDLSADSVQDKPDIKSIVQIYMAFSAAEDDIIGNLELPEWVVPIRLGNKISAKSLNILTDDMYPGNISDKNLLFAEMTGAWGIWHENGSTYKGCTTNLVQCRYFVAEKACSAAFRYCSKSRSSCICSSEK